MALATSLFVLSAAAAFVLGGLYFRERRTRLGHAVELESARSSLEQLKEVQQRASALESRFAGVVSAEAEESRIRDATRGLEAQLEEMRQKYAVGKSRLDSLNHTIRSLEEDLEAIDVGLYRPHFRYTDSDAYKTALEEVWEEQKALVKSGGASTCATTWTVGGSAREGEKMVKQTEKLILRAFNAECDSAVAKVAWNNHQVMEERIKKAAEALNKHGTVLQIRLTDRYVALRLKELQLSFEHEAKEHEEKEERRRQKAEQREEERAQRELARAQAEAEEDEVRYEKALRQSRDQLARVAEAERADLMARIATLEADLAGAHARKERAVAQAQLTRVGHVYVISNVGAFGEGVVKIGMTRRLDPEERVRELGDASVPFPFDLHALIFSENAPELESKLHERFWSHRVNWANDRKEFFRVGLTEVRTAMSELGLEADVISIAEAREFRETMAMRDVRTVPVRAPTRVSLADDPFQ